MSKYTTEVRFICENYAGLTNSEDRKSVKEVIEKACPRIFDFDFPIFDESYRLPLEIKILRHYYTREICAETVGLWKLWLENRLCEIMPYFNKLYESELFNFNPLYDVDIRTEHTRGNEGESSSNKTNGQTTVFSRDDDSTTEMSANDSENHSNSDSKWDYYSDTPQGDITGVNEKTYLTNLRKNTDDEHGSSDVTRSGESETKTNSKGTNTVNGTSNDNTTLKSTEEYAEHVIGKRGGDSYAKLLKEFRETFLNIDVEIINSLSDLFFTLW